LAEVVKNFRQFRDDATEKAQENERKLIELRNMAEALENENSVVFFIIDTYSLFNYN
jgi:hypothetical protein